MFGDEGREPVQIAVVVRIAGEGNQWRSEQGGRIAQRHPDPDGSDIDAEPPAAAGIARTGTIRTAVSAVNQCRQSPTAGR
ncbi:hypothetical protein GCM10027258_26360 [Amycolatopsis stemonae]